MISQNRDKFLKVCPKASTSIVNGDNKDWSGQIVFANVMERYEEIEKAYPGKVGILHGKMKPLECQCQLKVYQRFAPKVYH